MTLYDQLIANGVPPAEAVEYIANQTTKGVATTVPPTTPTSRISQTAQQRVVAHVLLQTAYKANKD